MPRHDVSRAEETAEWNGSKDCREPNWGVGLKHKNSKKVKSFNNLRKKHLKKGPQLQFPIENLTKDWKFQRFEGIAYLESVREGRVVGREDIDLGLTVGLFTVDLRKEKAGFEKDLQREAIGAHSREMVELGFWEQQSQ